MSRVNIIFMIRGGEMENLKGKGLISYCLSEEERRVEFIRDWINRHRHEFDYLEKVSKKDLINLILSGIAKRCFDQEKHGGFPVLMPISVGKAIHEKLPEEAKQIIEAWRDAEIADAGTDVLRAVEAAEIAGMALDRIKTREAVNITKLQKVNLLLGPREAAKKRTKEKDKKLANLHKAINEMFDKPEKPGWGMTNEEIQTFLLRNGNPFGYKDSVVLSHVKSCVAKWRKKRKTEALAQCGS